MPVVDPWYWRENPKADTGCRILFTLFLNLTVDMEVAINTRTPQILILYDLVTIPLVPL